MHELKKMITTFLKTKAERVFNEVAPSNIKFPYVVYSIGNSTTDDNLKMEQFLLTILIIGNNQFDSTDIDLLSANIDGDGAIVGATGLHRKHYYAANVLRAEFYRDSRDEMSWNDKNIREIELTYDAYVYLE